MLINGQSDRCILSKRGLRQGDPLSPLLFVVVVDAFTKLLELAISSALIKGLNPSNFDPKVNCIQHADDTILFGKADMNQLGGLKLFLYGFELAFGLQINSMLNCQIVPITYLGIPLRPIVEVKKIMRKSCTLN